MSQKVAQLTKEQETASKIVIFTDEKYSALLQYSNRQNDKLVLPQGEQHLVSHDHCAAAQAQPLAGVMFLGIIPSKRLCCTFHLHQKGV